MALDYFGYTTPATEDYWSGQAAVQTGNGYACPGSGSRTVEELSGSFKIASGTAHILLVIYTLNGLTRVAMGSAEVTVTGTGYSWQGHMSQSAISPNPLTLTGGDYYRLGFTCDGSTIYNEGKAGVGGCAYGGQDYTGGDWPSTFTNTTNYDFSPALRIGLTQTSGALSVSATDTFTNTQALD